MDVKEVQRRLWEQSEAHRENRESSLPLFPTNPYDKRIRNLSDLIHHPVWLEEAASLVLRRSKGKASGVDGMTVAKFKQNLADNVERLRRELKKGTYQPQPLRRVEIPKANGKMRQLGIPCLRDKIVQEAIRMMLEPIFEVEFHDNSYGFRPNRNTHHAVYRCYHMMKGDFTWVIEGDVKACFDEISHKSILKAIREKVMDNKFLGLVRLFLKAGVMIEGVHHPTAKGVPQGGVVSPLLANIVLNKLDWFLHEKGVYEENARIKAWRKGSPNVRFARYADDWCVFVTRTSKRYVESLREQIREFLKSECGLQLSEEKTKITHVRDGFDFLGFRLCVGVGKAGNMVPKIKVGQKAKHGIRHRLNEAIRYRPQQESIATRISRSASVIRGWSNYFKIAHDFSRVATRLDNVAYVSMLKAICRKKDLSTAQCLRRYYFNGRLGVSPEQSMTRFSDTKMARDYRAPKEYAPGLGRYLEDQHHEVNFFTREKIRPGNADLKWEALRRDQYRCRNCDGLVLAETSHLDHIKPVSSFASYEQASTLDNVQTLCLYCHKQKTRSEQSKA